MAGMGGVEKGWFPEFLGSFSLYHLPIVAHLDWELPQSAQVFHDEADGRWFRTSQFVLLAKWLQKHKDFVLAEIRMFIPETAYLLDDGRRP